MNSHAPEPWSLRELRDDAGKLEFLEIRFPDDGHLVVYEKPSQVDIATCKRVVACVNACRGIRTDELEVDPGNLTNLAFKALVIQTMLDKGTKTT